MSVIAGHLYQHGGLMTSVPIAVHHLHLQEELLVLYHLDQDLHHSEKF